MTDIMFCSIGTNVYSKNRAEWEVIAILPIFHIKQQAPYLRFAIRRLIFFRREKILHRRMDSV
ncbi:MAG: hypothetical protein IJ738_04830 [Alphaproteobacteria bacterium]|nr:hypothetical protein [Alphaproteobacteria bacterium]